MLNYRLRRRFAHMCVWGAGGEADSSCNSFRLILQGRLRARRPNGASAFSAPMSPVMPQAHDEGLELADLGGAEGAEGATDSAELTAEDQKVLDKIDAAALNTYNMGPRET